MRATLARDSMAVAILLALVAAPAFAQDGTPTTISDIRQETSAGSTRLTVECSGRLRTPTTAPTP